MRRIPWDVLLMLIVGLGLGLGYAWLISPLRITNADPISLRADFKESYRSAIAASFAATGNLPRAQARLALLGDADPIGALNAQAQRMLAGGESLQQADQIAALALALEDGTEGNPTPILATEDPQEIDGPATETLPLSPTDLPVATTETPESIETQSVVETPASVMTSTPRPTATPIPTLGEPFVVTAQDNICDTNLPDGLLQVTVLSSNRRQMPGMKILITWDGGEESFFTGLKPELGNGYADYSMTANVTYTVQLAAGSDIAAGLIAPTCQLPNGETYFGGIKLTFQQP